MAEMSRSSRATYGPIRRLDAEDKATGRALYAGDITLPGMIVGKVVPSPVVHGILRHVETAEAACLPGVLAVLTAADIPGENRLMGMMDDQEYLAADRVRSLGDPVCLVGAEDEETAVRACGCIRIVTDPLPVVRTPEEAMTVGAPKIHNGGNVARELRIARGDIEHGFDAADVVVENTYTTQVIEHAYLEPEAAIAYTDEDGILRVIAASHSVHQERQNIAHALGLPADRIRVTVPTIGGSFGGKDDHLLPVYVGLLARRTGRAARITWSRQESFLLSYKRHGTSVFMKTGARKDGLLTAIHAKLVYDTGAYKHWGPGILGFAACQATGPYIVPNLLIEAYSVYTNNLRAGAMRAWGTPQVAFAWESQMDQLAAALGIHPLEFRWRNAVREGSIGATGGRLPEGVGLRETIRRAAALSGLALTDT